jgi:hypothetical protein
MNDLVVLTADKDASFAVDKLLSRTASLGIVDVTRMIYVHPKRDHGAYLDCHNFLRQFLHIAGHALVICDRHGCGREQDDRVDIEADMERRLSVNGWQHRCAAIVIDPELEAWLWSDSPQVAAALGWTEGRAALDRWLATRGHLLPGQVKPLDPKAAVNEALRMVKKRRSSAIYADLARKVSVDRCVDPAFVKLKRVLQRWFGVGH